MPVPARETTLKAGAFGRDGIPLRGRKQDYNKMAMKAGRWRGELDAATTDKDVLNVVRDYVALLTRDEIAELPRGCRPMSIDNAGHINEWAVRLITQCLEHHSGSDGYELLRNVSDFFAAASARLTALHPSDHRL